MKFLRLIMVVLAVFVAGQSPADDVRPLFRDDAVFNAVLTAPLTQAYARKKDDVRLYLPGTLSFLENDSAKQRVDLSIRTRGVFRRKNCRLPPLLLNFKKKSVKGTVFSKQDKIKLVSPCSASKAAQQQLVLEYLAYQAFEQLSDLSLKTRLIRMSYIDSDGKKKPWTHLTFLIEEEEDLARRHALRPVHVSRVENSQLDERRAALVELFQYMIGNTDFSMLRAPAGKHCCHNMQILGKHESSSNYIPVPYDFDSAGLIDARYASPSENLPIKDVRKRLYRGRCRPVSVMEKTFEIFRSHQSDILSLFSESEHLNERNKEKSVRYLDEFFDILGDQESIQRHILDRCRR